MLMRAEIFSLDLAPMGMLGIMAHPRGGDWLADEMQALADANVDVLVSLLTAAEQWQLQLTEEEQICREQGLHYFAFPIADRNTPPMNQAILNLIDSLAD